MSSECKPAECAEATASMEMNSTSTDAISRRGAMSVMAKYGAATAPVMLTLFQGQRAAAAGSGASEGNGDVTPS